MKKIASDNVFIALQEKYLSMNPHLNERSRRIWAASEAKAIGHGGKKILSQVTGLTYVTIQKCTDPQKLDHFF